MKLERTKKHRDAKAAARAAFLPRRARPLPASAPSPTQAMNRNVLGVGLGPKVTGDRRLKTMSVRIYVRHKLPDDVLPERLRVPREIRGVPTDVIELGRFRASAGESNRRLARPFSMGASIGHDRKMAGTAGALLRLKGGGDARRFVLSNNHVLADSNRLKAGAPVFQAGKLDGGPPQPIARLTTYIRLSKSAAQANFVDCAIAELESPDLAVSDLIDLGGSCDRKVVAAEVGMRVTKTGRTSGVTLGIIDDVDFDIEVDYPRLGSVVFEDQILILPDQDHSRFSEDGDSGALVLKQGARRSPVGLLFASSEKGKAVASHLSDVLAELRVGGSALEIA
jgi:hypothetical protein